MLSLLVSSWRFSEFALVMYELKPPQTITWACVHTHSTTLTASQVKHSKPAEWTKKMSVHIGISPPACVNKFIVSYGEQSLDIRLPFSNILLLMLIKKKQQQNREIWNICMYKLKHTEAISLNYISWIIWHPHCSTICSSLHPSQYYKLSRTYFPLHVICL